ncbi:hypothetical protein SDC9_170942 [bioreactor metagenome]|uniref:Uncharacterized protein n=1 Tax=bioreactor metagenome TaxID=1076179 RepID=A0A645GBW6_9ZZZZ
MRHGLSLKTGFELAESHVSDKRREDEGGDALKQVRIPDHDQVAHRADRAETRALREPADDESGAERDKDGGVSRSRPLL